MWGSISENPACPGTCVSICCFDFPGEVVVIRGLLELAGIKTLLVDPLSTKFLSLPLECGWPMGLRVPKESVARAIGILSSTLLDESESEQ